MLSMPIEVALHRSNGERVSGLADPNGGTFDAAGDFDALLGSPDLPVLGGLDPYAIVTLDAATMPGLISDVDNALALERQGAQLSRTATPARDGGDGASRPLTEPSSGG